jgi:hypothetical protein
VTSRSALIVTGWLAGNAALMVLLLAFGEWLLAVLLYAASLLPLALFTLAVWRDRRHATGSPERFTVPPAGAFLLPIAAGITLAGLGFVFGRWLIPLGMSVVLVCLGAGRLVNRPVVPAGAPAAMTELPIVRPGDRTRRQLAAEVGPVTERVARVAVLTVLAGAVFGRLLHRGRRP